jgi:hypothetical protein
MPSPLQGHQNTNKAAAVENLGRLGAIIEDELMFWMGYLSTLAADHQHYEAITAENISPESRRKSMQHMLDTLPLRHKALAIAYNHESIEDIELPPSCSALLERLKDEAGAVDLGDFYDYKLFKGKRFRQDVLAQEAEVGELEQARLEVLKGLMELYETLKILEGEKALESGHVQRLVETMDDAGLSANSAVAKNVNGK